MKDRATRRHQELKAKRRYEKQYNSCMNELSAEDRNGIEGRIEKMKKVCANPYSEDHDRKLGKKTVQELRHDITMKEQLH